MTVSEIKRKPQAPGNRRVWAWGLGVWGSRLLQFRGTSAILMPWGWACLGAANSSESTLRIDRPPVPHTAVYAPAGVGALFVREGVTLPVWMHGAGHEGGRRAGTENTMHLVGLGAACRLCREGMEDNARRMKEARDELHSLLSQKMPGLRLNGHPGERLPNTLNVSFPPSCPTSHKMIAATVQRVAFSAGSACHSDVVHVSWGALPRPLHLLRRALRPLAMFSRHLRAPCSVPANAVPTLVCLFVCVLRRPDFDTLVPRHVLAAMYVGEAPEAVKERASRACRFSTGRYTTLEQIREAAAAILKAAGGEGA